MTEDEMVTWHHQLNGHEFEEAPGDNEGQGSLACCRPWGRKESVTTSRLNNSMSIFNKDLYTFKKTEKLNIMVNGLILSDQSPCACTHLKHLTMSQKEPEEKETLTLCCRRLQTGSRGPVPTPRSGRSIRSP